MQHIGGPLKKFLKSSGLEKGVAQQSAIDFWSEAVGESVAKNTEPLYVEHGTMTVKTETPVWRQELQFQKTQIIETLNKKFNKKIIKDIRFI